MNGEKLPASSMRNSEVDKMVEHGVINKLQQGISKSVLFVNDTGNLRLYLQNHYAINNLEAYINTFQAEEILRNDAVLVSGNSKLRPVRTFTGFLVNVYEEVNATMNGKPIRIQPADGAYTFIHDYKAFVPDAEVTIVGIENPENFRLIHRQKHLFQGIKPLFISRYPQSNDVIKWLQSIPNKYLHFGDLDFEGINIYLNEYQKHLGTKGSFFIPPNTIELLQQHGNRELYHRQLHRAPAIDKIEESGIGQLLQAFYKYEKVLEQEVFIGP